MRLESAMWRLDRLEAGAGDDLAQQVVVDGKPHRKLGRFGGDPLCHPEEQRLALDLVQKLAREAGGFEPAGNDNGGVGHRDGIAWAVDFGLQAARTNGNFTGLT